MIARAGTVGTPVAIGSASGTSFTVLEWVSSDIDGFRSTSTPNWSGIIDFDAASTTATSLNSPATDTDSISSLINTLSYGDSGINNAALYFIGSNSDINAYGWDGAALTDQTGVMHPINSTGALTNFVPAVGDFTGIDVYEYYKLAWTAYAVVYEPGANGIGTLRLYYDYQPWNGETLANGKNAVIMEGISTFQFMAIGSIMKIQVCAKSLIVDGENDTGGYSLCKEKTVF